MWRPCKGHGMSCLWLPLPKPNTGRDYSDMKFTDCKGHFKIFMHQSTGPWEMKHSKGLQQWLAALIAHNQESSSCGAANQCGSLSPLFILATVRHFLIKHIIFHTFLSVCIVEISCRDGQARFDDIRLYGKAARIAHAPDPLHLMPNLRTNCSISANTAVSQYKLMFAVERGHDLHPQNKFTKFRAFWWS